jgi:perosamine synthetase
MIPITRPAVGEEEAQAAAEAVRSGWLSQGMRVAEFERAVADFVGTTEAVATTNCTSALHLSLIAAGVGPGDEVVCPSFTFIATANAILHTGAVPVFVDIDPETFNITAEAAGRAINSRTKGIMPVAQIGLAVDTPAITQLAHGLGIAVIEDAAPSLGATIGEGRTGSFADFTCFSFHPRKSITAGEGGMITTNDGDAAGLLRQLRSHGASTSDLSRHRTGTTTIEQYDVLGYNYRMTDVQAAVGIVQMGKLPAILAERRERAQRYNELLGGDERFRVPSEPAGFRHTYQSYCIRLRSGRPRSDVMNRLLEVGIATRRGVMAIHREPFYRERYPDVSLPVTERASEETLLLPLYVGMTDDEQDQVVHHLRRAV